MAKTKIKITETDENILLYGITTQLNDYKFTWLLNSELDTDLIKVDDYLANKKGITEDLTFTAYQNSDNSNDIILVSNKNDNSIKLINIPTIDFLLKINSSKINIDEFINKLRKLQGVIAVTDIKNNPNIQKKILKEITDFLK